MKLLTVIDPAAHTPEIECFNHIARQSPLPATYHLPALQGLDSLLDVERDTAGVIILGSSTSVHDNATWQLPLLNWLLQQVEKQIPTLGICYAHQLFAHHYGGKVEFIGTDKSKQLGFRKVEFKPNTLLEDSSLKGPLFVSHREHVTQCPQNMEPIASSPGFPFDGLKHTQFNLWTLQPHPESTAGFLSNQKYEHPIDSGALDFGHSVIRAFLNRLK